MGRYGAAGSPPGVNTANTTYLQLRPTSASATVRLIRIVAAISTAPSNAPIWVLQRSTAVGTATTSPTVKPFDTADASLAAVDTVLSVQPTLTAGPLDTGAYPSAIGNAWVFAFNDGPIIIRGTANGICLVNTVAAGATLGVFQVSAVWDE